MTIQIIQTILLLMVLALVLYANKVVDQRMKQIKSDYYLKGYKDGCTDGAEKTTEYIKEYNKRLQEGWEIDKAIYKNEVL